MRQIINYGDERQTVFCAHCGGTWDTEDHVPSKVLLDKPLPANLPLVGACRKCNNELSLYEEYLACLIDCAIAGTTEPCDRHRPKIRRILERRPKIAARIAATRREVDGQIWYAPERERVSAVMLKLARGHALYELNEYRADKPSLIWKPLPLLTENERETFERPVWTGEPSVWPEVGSRALQRLVEDGAEWVVVQEGRYRYMVAASVRAIVKMVLSEYLYCEAIWE